MWLVGRLQSVDLRIKWPNDIYFGREMKLGGIIVKSSVMNDVIHVNIGAFLSVCLSVCLSVTQCHMTQRIDQAMSCGYDAMTL